MSALYRLTTLRRAAVAALLRESRLGDRLLLHDLEAAGLQLPNDHVGEVRAFLRHDPAWASPIGIAFLRVGYEGGSDGGHDDFGRV